MDERMLYCFLDYQKGKEISLGEKLKKFPWTITISAILVVLAIAYVFLAILIPKLSGGSWVAVLVEMVSCGALYFFEEHFQIKNSNQTIEDFRKYSQDLEVWLKQYSFSSDRAIRLLHKRLANHINEIRLERKDKNDRLKQWLQVLAVPAILAIITVSISNQTNIFSMFATVTNILSAFFVFYGFITVFHIILDFPQKKQLEQMKYFADDLQYILDMHTIDNISTETDRRKNPTRMAKSSYPNKNSLNKNDEKNT